MSYEDQKREIAITNLRYAEELRIHAAKEADRVKQRKQSRIGEIEAKIDDTEKLQKNFQELLMRFKNHENQPDEEARLQSHVTNAEDEISRLRRELSVITKQQDPPPRNLSPSEKEVVCWQFVYPDKRLEKEMSPGGLDETFVDLKIKLDQWTADAKKEYDEITLPSSSSSSSSSSSARLSPLSPSSASLSLLSPSSARLLLLTPSRRLPSTPLPSSFSTSSDYVNKYVFDHLVDFKDKDKKVEFDFDEMLSRMTMPGVPGMAIKGMSTVDSSSEDEFDDVLAGISSKPCKVFFNRGVSAIDAIRQSSNVVMTLGALASDCYDDFAGASAAAAAAAAPVDFARVTTGGPLSMFNRGDWEQSKRTVDAFLGNTERERQELNALKEYEELKERVEQITEQKEAKQDKNREENQKQEEYVKRVIAGREEVKAEEAEAAAAKAAAEAAAAKAAAEAAASAAAASEQKKWFRWGGKKGGKQLQRRILSRRKSKSHRSRKNKSHHGRKNKSRRKRQQQSTKRNR